MISQGRPVRCAGVVFLGLAAGCAPDIGELEDLPSADSVAVAQFDPTNPIPQLQLIPSPTRLAETADGLINKDAVAPAPCELPTTAQCLAFIDGGWPVTLFPTLYFSAPLTEESLASQGLGLYAVRAGGQLEAVPFTARQAPRPAPPVACQTDNNGTTPLRTFGPSEIAAAWGPEPYDVVLVPDAGAFEPGTQYVVFATTALQAQPSTSNGGPRALEPSALFYLLNSDTAPVAETGQILNPLLRSNVAASVLANAFPGKASVDELSEAEKAQFAAAFASSGQSLFGLYQFVNGTVAAIQGNQLVSDRSELIIVNTWTTGTIEPAATEIVFDPVGTTFPTDVRFPFPNDQLLTMTASTPSGVQVALPADDIPAGTLRGLVEGLNTLDGFGLTSPIVLQTSRTLNQASLTDNVHMIELDASGAPTGNQPAIFVVATASTTDIPSPQLIIQPINPLNPATTYAVGISTGVLDVDGNPVAAAQTFDLLKSPTPLVSGTTVPSPIKELLECSTLSQTGMLASPEVVIGTATALENDLARPRWQAAFEAFEALGTPVPRTQMAMAFTYTTQSVTPTVDLVKSQLLPLFEMMPPNTGDLVLPAVVDVVEGEDTTLIADNLIDVGMTFCVPVCESGALEPLIPRDQCVVDDGSGGEETNPALLQSPPCQLLRGAYGGTLGRARMHFVRTYDLTSGNPYVSGTFDPAKFQAPGVNYVPFWVVTPRGTAPAGGWPVVIFQHGLGGEKETGLLVANTLASAGYATVAMDMPLHGQRASDIANQAGIPCTDVDPDAVTCDIQTGVCTGGCDDVQDSSGSGFLSPNVFGVRDNFRQAIVDHLSLLRALSDDELSDLDPTRVGYLGQSLGGIAGANLAAFVGTDEIDATVLNVAGGNLIEILTNTVPNIAAALYFGLASAGVCELNDPLNPAAGCKDTPLYRTFLLVAQWVMEPGDPKGTSVGVVDQLPGRPANLGADRVLMQISQPDPVVANIASRQLGSAYGFDVMGGDEHYQVFDFTNLPNATQGSGCHGFLVAPICGACLEATLCNTFGAQIQAAGFIASSGANITPVDQMTLFSGSPFQIDCANPCN